MSINYKLNFGGVDLPVTLRPDGGSSDFDLAESERPRLAGSVTQSARAKSRLLSVRGDIYGDTPDLLWAALDSLGAAYALGATGPLYFGRDDRYFNAQVETFSSSYTEGMLWGVVASVSIGFRAAQPFALATAPTAAPGLTSVGGTVTPDGNAATPATWTITVSAAGTGPIVLTNTASGQAATLGGAGTAWASGDTVVLTRGQGIYTVTKNGILAPGLLLGLIPTLVPGPNVITLSAPAGGTLGALGCSYTARWQS